MPIDTATLASLAFHATLMVIAITAGTTIVGAIAFWRAESGQAETFSVLLERANALQMLAVILIIVAAVVLRLTNAIGAEAVVSILSGVAGYVLGRVKSKPSGRDRIDPQPTAR
jgi:phosphatidylglycerophosphate synthase